MGPGRPFATGGGVIRPDDEGIVDDENERTGVSSAGGEWTICLYAKRTCFGALGVRWWGIGSRAKKLKIGLWCLRRAGGSL